MRNKKELAGKILKVSPKKIRFAPDALEDIQKAITRSDIRGLLVAVGKIFIVAKNQHSRYGARRVAAQKRKGRRRGERKPERIKTFQSYPKRQMDFKNKGSARSLNRIAR